MILGIDLGTTYSLIGIICNNAIKILKDPETNSELIPSYEGVKKLIGKEQVAVLKSSLTLKKLKAIANKYFEKDVCDCIITVPAHYNDIQRSAVKQACVLANLNPLRIINEPTAAAMAYNINGQDKVILVYDFGGGTFDVSIVHIVNGVYEVISTAGDLNLGGNDIDFRISTNYNISLLEAKELKHKGKIDIYSCCKDIINKTIKLVKECLTSASMTYDDIDEVLLVGGSSRLLCVHKLMSKYFKNSVINNSLDPDKTVVYGATIMAKSLMDKSDILLVDIISLSLGIEIENGLMSVIVPSGTKLPINISRLYTTNEDNQTECLINIYQGNSKYVKNNTLIEQMHIKNIPKLSKGKHVIIINFAISIDGICTITAKSEKELYTKIIWQKA